MKNKDRDSLRSMKTSELMHQLHDVRAKQTDLQLQSHQGKLKNLHEIKTLRKKIAVILTFLKNKETSV